MKIVRNLRLPFCRTFNFTPLGVFRLCVTSKLYNLAAFKNSPLSDPKWRNMTPLKHNLLEKLSTDISEILIEDVKLMLEVLKILRR